MTSPITHEYSLEKWDWKINNGMIEFTEKKKCVDEKPMPFDSYKGYDGIEIMSFHTDESHRIEDIIFDYYDKNKYSLKHKSDTYFLLIDDQPCKSTSPDDDEDGEWDCKECDNRCHPGSSHPPYLCDKCGVKVGCGYNPDCERVCYDCADAE